VRAGILGGTFDPVHTGHLVLAEQARSQLPLDVVLFLPAGRPWRKSERVITDASHRLAMLRLAVAGNDAFAIVESELRGEGPTYTADTLERLAADRPDDELWFIAGADALADMPNWHDPVRILRYARLAAAARNATEGAMPLPPVEGIEDRTDRFGMPRLDISSTDIRARVAGGRSIRYLVPDAVAAYITKRALYTGVASAHR
jgi:nicotinate-nucleotide adenylyltransferase